MTQAGMVLVVSVSIIRDDKVLIIQENKPSARLQWNFPSGRMEQGEDILEAARREVREETGYDVLLTGTTGIYHFISSTNYQVILFHFTGEIVGGALQLEANEIIDCRWIETSDLLIPDRILLREADVMKQIANNLIRGKVHTLALFNQALIK